MPTGEARAEDWFATAKVDAAITCVGDVISPDPNDSL